MTDGKVLKNAEVIQFEADGPVIKHDGGTNHIVWNDLSPAVRRRYQAEARKQKEKEIQKLKQDLARAEAEAVRLGQGVGQPESKTLAPPEQSVNSTAPGAAADAPPKPVAQLPPLKPDEIVDAAGLVQQFKNDPSGAQRRYRNKVFRVKGVIERFEPKLFIRKYDVIFESPDRFVRVVAAFDYPGDYRTCSQLSAGRCSWENLPKTQRSPCCGRGRRSFCKAGAKARATRKLCSRGAHGSADPARGTGGGS